MVGMFVVRVSPVLSLCIIDDFPVPSRPNNTILGSISWKNPENGFPRVIPISLVFATKLTLFGFGNITGREALRESFKVKWYGLRVKSCVCVVCFKIR